MVVQPQGFWLCSSSCSTTSPSLLNSRSFRASLMCWGTAQPSASALTALLTALWCCCWTFSSYWKRDKVKTAPSLPPLVMASLSVTEGQDSHCFFLWTICVLTGSIKCRCQQSNQNIGILEKNKQSHWYLYSTQVCTHPSFSPQTKCGHLLFQYAL